MNKRTGAGRPEIDPTKRKTRMISAHVTEVEKAEVRLMAKKAGKSESDLLRSIILVNQGV